MVRINLLKKKSPGASDRSMPSPKLLLVPVAALCLAALLAGGFLFFRKRVPEKPSATVVRTQTSFTPSTYRKSDIVEDVVREVSSERNAAGKGTVLDLAYEELSFLEKVNFEVLFCKNVFTMLSRAVPSGIGLKSLEIDNFQTIYAVGLGTTRDLVSSTFIALKSEKIELLPQPYSYITSNNGDGFRFVVTCKTRFGLDLADPFQASDHLPVRDDLPLVLRNLLRIGGETGVNFSGKPEQTGAETIGAFRRYLYRFRGISTYNDFVRYLITLHENKIPCAFKKVDLKALSGTSLSVETHVILTVRE